MNKLPAFTSSGCYTILYLNKKDECLCAECATNEGLQEKDGHTFDEGDSIFCDECGIEIESSYGPAGF